MADPPKSNLVLIGYRGSGKTTVGRAAAQRLGYRFVDTDDRIVAEAGTTIAEIFAAEGESGFRDREAAAVERASALTGCVISAGGGAILRADNVERLRRSGFVVWLTAPAEVLCRRIEGDASTSASRPALTGLSGLAEVRSVLSARESAYRRAADVSVDAAGDDVSAVVDEVLAAYETGGGGSSDA
jgi:shikimate kinase